MKKALFVAAIVAAGACGGSSAKVPTIAVTTPAAGASVALGTDADKSVTLGITLANFDVKPANHCGGLANCGHIHVLIDGSACSGGGFYNNTDELSATSAVAKFGRCTSPKGAHTVTLELHGDTHDPVLDNSGNKILASVSFTTI
jgi:hypothetical protein